MKTSTTLQADGAGNARRESDLQPKTVVGAPGGTLPPPEISGPAGPEPTRYGDWERRGRCIDF
jgi:hypothetical protein